MAKMRLNESLVLYGHYKVFHKGLAREVRAHITAVEDGLGYCPNCDHEYTDKDVVRIPESFDGSGVTDFCPNCGQEDLRILYWCNQDPTEPLHSPEDCEKYHHEP